MTNITITPFCDDFIMMHFHFPTPEQERKHFSVAKRNGRKQDVKIH